MIYYETENETTLQQYWPMGTTGSVLLTSRKYYNFAKDIDRKGESVKPFDTEQSWELLQQLLGDDWKKMELDPSEIAEAKSMLKELEGLALAIQQTAVLIKDPKIGGLTIAKTYQKFRERRESLPDRHSSQRSSSEKSLDALWDIIFKSLSPKARVLIGVFAWLDPGMIILHLAILMHVCS